MAAAAASSFNFSSASPPSTPSSSRGSPAHDYSFKILMIGDSAVGKSSILLKFISDSDHEPSPTIGVDFKMKTVVANDKRLKLTIWDTAGQERFGTLTTSYYRGAHGIVLVYDVTKRDTFTNLSEIWARDVEHYSTNHECVKLLVGNKVDKDSDRAVSREEGMALAQGLKSLSAFFRYLKYLPCWKRDLEYRRQPRFEQTDKRPNKVEEMAAVLDRSVLQASALQRLEHIFKYD
ncbi:unnamed protein product [Linum tenue]|uniref:Uncharacterized protein n=1 Tax=Linum tenue TaxID=586396 RepID=A0AAV0JLP1_9ROSI|nr:unnamed protein product [Linum tenue]